MLSLFLIDSDCLLIVIIRAISGQIDGQEITAAPVLLPKPRPVPPRRSPPMPLRRPPPRWGRSPPR